MYNVLVQCMYNVLARLSLILESVEVLHVCVVLHVCNVSLLLWDICINDKLLLKSMTGCDKITDLLQRGINWPRGLGKSIAGGDESMGL